MSIRDVEYVSSLLKAPLVTERTFHNSTGLMPGCIVKKGNGSEVTDVILGLV
jgi:hypothetical protein